MFLSQKSLNLTNSHTVSTKSAQRRWRLLPRTLRWQTFLLVALLVASVLAMWEEIFRHFEQVQRARDISRMVSSVVNISRAALINADRKRRSSLLIDLTALEGISIYPAEKTDVLTPLPNTRQFRLITASIREQMGAKTRFAASWEGIEGFWVSFKIDENDKDDYWVKLPRDKIERTHALEWVFWTFATLGISLIVAFLTVSRINTPLLKLAAAARMIEHQENPPLMNETGPEEIAELTRAFNQMNHALAQADKERALILAGVSHDLRTPLARLRLGIELSGAPEQDVEAMVADIEDMNRIIQQFLDFARGQTQEPMQPVDLIQLMQECTQPYTLRALPIMLELPKELSTQGYPLLLRRALKNLIDNALRYAGEESPLHVSCDKTSEGYPYIEVADRGPGIPLDQIEHMRQPFTRMESARSNVVGTGLGLAIVDRIAKAHHGEFQLLPRPGGGLIARIVLHVHTQA